MIPPWLLLPVTKFAAKGGLKLFAGIGIAIAVALLVWRIHHHGYVAGKDHVQAKWDVETAEYQRQALAIEMRNHEIERQAQDKIDEQSQQITALAQATTMANAAADIESERMRGDLASARRRLNAAIAGAGQQVDAAARAALGECADESERIQSELGTEVERVGRAAERNADTVTWLQDYARLAQSVCGG